MGEPSATRIDFWKFFNDPFAGGCGWITLGNAGSPK